MKLIFFRHGLAMDRAESSSRKLQDSLRPLVEKGKSRSQKMARYLLKREQDVDLIVTSPYLRAMQTAEIIASVYGLQKKIVESPELVPSAPPQALQQWLRKQSPELTSLIIVGHEPQLTTFCSWATAGTVQGFIDLKKSGIICLELECIHEIQERSAQINWIVQPASVLK